MTSLLALAIRDARSEIADPSTPLCCAQDCGVRWLGPPLRSSQLPRVPRPCRIFCDRAGILTYFARTDALGAGAPRSNPSVLRSSSSSGPMNSVATAGNFPVLALRGGGVEQARMPDERHGDDAAVAQAHADGVIRELDVQHALIRIAMRRRCRKTHSMPPKTADANPSPSIVSRAVFYIAFPLRPKFIDLQPAARDNRNLIGAVSRCVRPPRRTSKLPQNHFQRPLTS